MLQRPSISDATMMTVLLCVVLLFLFTAHVQWYTQAGYNNTTPHKVTIKSSNKKIKLIFIQQKSTNLSKATFAIEVGCEE